MRVGRGGARIVLALALAPLGWSAAEEAAGARPTLVVPARPDSATLHVPESAPAPLLIPGRFNSPDTLKKTPAQRARESFQLGAAFERQNQGAAAIAAYQNALAFDPGLPEANYRIGLLYLTRDQVAPAVRHFTAEVRHHPDHRAAERELGIGLARLGDTTQAIARLEDLTRRVPTEDEGWHALSFAYSAAGRVRDAEAALRHALALAPARAIEHRDLGVLLAREGRDREAREQYQEALALDPSDASVWYNLGNLDRRAGDLKRALRSFREAEKRDSNFTLALLGQITVFRQQGKSREVGAVYRRWLARRPDDHETRVEAVRHFAREGRTDLGIELGRDAVRWAPRSGDAHLVLGVALDMHGKTRAALEELRTAESLFRDAPSLDQVRRVIGDLRARAPDSLRAVFHADSVAHARPSP